MKDVLIINNTEIDKFEAYDLLYEILKDRYIKMSENPDSSVYEEIYYEIADLIYRILGEDNIDEFIEYTQEI